jgi:hypothetical protein
MKRGGSKLCGMQPSRATNISTVSTGNQAAGF